ncbi:MAG TPA: hypothetical protein VGC86_14630 [Afipia sp.]
MSKTAIGFTAALFRLPDTPPALPFPATSTLQSGAASPRSAPHRSRTRISNGGLRHPKILCDTATATLGKPVSPQLGDTKLILGIEYVFNIAYVDASTVANPNYQLPRCMW